MRTPFIAANWKMYKTVHEAVVFVKEFRSLVKDVTAVEIVVAPPFTALHAVVEAARSSNIGVAAERAQEREGASRARPRRHLKERAPSTDPPQAPAAVRGDGSARQPKAVGGPRRPITPIVCIGETSRREARNAGVLDRQIRRARRLTGTRSPRRHC